MRKRTAHLFTALLLLSATASAADDPVFGSNFDPNAGFRTFRIPDRNDAAACSGALNASAQIQRVYFAQTHLLETTHPFFVLTANRPVLVKADVTGTGAAPQVQVTATNGAVIVGQLCLSGPATLPASVDAAQQTRADSYTVTLPADWIRPGLELTIRTGNATRTFPATALKIGAEPILTLLAPDIYLFGDTTPSAKPANWQYQYLSTLMISALNVSPLVDFVSERMPIEPRSDGRNGNGVAMAQPAMLATRRPSCTAAEQTAGTCTRYGGYAVLNSVRGVLGALRAANGMDYYAQAYGTLSANQSVGGGLAGGGIGAGDDYGLTFNHEMGHSADMPHWGSSWYGRNDATATQRHPYAGQFGTLPDNPNGGGFGNSWGYDMYNDRFISPICAATGKERQEPMQRSGSSCAGTGQAYDYFSDYSSLFDFRYMVGAASAYSGTIPYPRDPLGNTAGVPFSFPSKNGNVVIVQPNAVQPLLKKWDATLADYTVQATPALSANLMKHRYAQQYNTRVVLFWGAFSATTPEVNLIGKPQRYTGNLKKTWNPADPTDFSDIKSWVSGDAFWWGADLVLRVNYTDGSQRQAVMKYAPRGTDPLNGSSFAIWGINLPDDKTVASATLYHRPMEVRNPGDNRPYNINYSGNTTTAANYLDSATAVATWTP
ncbi:MAG: hypothetical protein JNN30_07460 [Rhodanobacteraceae bacterium]|nr:hypothetical protein [Rhodanobacteraceae bacterium]